MFEGLCGEWLIGCGMDVLDGLFVVFGYFMIILVVDFDVLWLSVGEIVIIGILIDVVLILFGDCWII